MAEIMDAPATAPEAPAQPAQTDTGWVKPTGELGESAPEDIRDLFSKKKWNNIRQVVDGYKELEKFKGIGKHLVIPEADDKEGWNKIYNELGRPETPDKYQFEDDGDVPLNDTLTSRFKEFAHVEGLTQKQADSIVKFQRDVIKETLAAEAAQKEAQKAENMKILQGKYKEDTPAKIKDARDMADKLGIYNTLEEKGLASDPDIIIMLETIASRSDEGVITPTAPVEPQKSPAEELNDIMASEAFKQKFHKDHKAIMARYMELNQIIAASGKTRQPRI